MNTPKALYDQAYDMQYKGQNLEGAVAIYRTILDEHPQSQEAAYAKSQLGNIVKKERYPEQLLRDKKQADLEVERGGLKQRLVTASEEHARAVNDFWQYQVLVDASAVDLNRLGSMGWELVAVTAYTTGGGLTINGSGGSSYTVHTQYALKRKLPRDQSESEQELSVKLAAVDVTLAELSATS